MTSRSGAASLAPRPPPSPKPRPPARLAQRLVLLVLGSLCVTVHLHDSGSRDIRRRQRSKVSYARHYRLRTAPEDMTILVVRHGPHLRLLNDASGSGIQPPLHEVVYGALGRLQVLERQAAHLIIRQHDCD